jgi:hypothetical protein
MKTNFALVLELVDPSAAGEITQPGSIPTIGIGSGTECDGQILVFHDLVGYFPWFKPKRFDSLLISKEKDRSATRLSNACSASASAKSTACAPSTPLQPLNFTFPVTAAPCARSIPSTRPCAPANTAPTSASATWLSPRRKPGHQCRLPDPEPQGSIRSLPPGCQRIHRNSQRALSFRALHFPRNGTHGRHWPPAGRNLL